MANNRVQVKRTSTTGRTPNTTASYATNSQYISAGELALNMTDGILYSSNGSAIIEIGANNTNARVTGNLTINAVISNGSLGSAGQVLTSNGTATYWAAATASATAGGANTQIQFNDSTAANGSAGFTFVKTTNNVNVANSINAASHTVGTSFTANATLVNTAAINITGQTNTATLFVTTSANLASSNVITNTAGIFVTNTTGVVNAAVHSVGTIFVANTTQTSINSNTTVGNATFANTFLNSFTGISNPQSLTAGVLQTNASLNTLLVGPYTISSGNSLVITTGSRLVII